MQSRLVRWIMMLALLGVATLAVAQDPFGQQGDFLPPDQAFKPTLVQDGDAVEIDWQIEPGYYLYRHSFSAQVGERALPLEIPDGETIEDEYFGRSEIYRHALSMTTQPGEADTLTLHWQGCADAGLCYPPQQRTFELESVAGASGSDTTDARKTDISADVPNTSSTTPSSVVPSPTSQPQPQAAAEMAEDQQLAAQLAGGNWVWTLTVFFGLGLLLTFTPCVLPMIPILSSLIVGQRRDGENRRAAGFVLSLAYALPMAATYAILGVAAAMAGANLQMLFQNAWFIGIFSVLFVVLALAMFGVFELELPRALRQRLDAGLSKQRGGRFKGVAVMGVLSALLVGPCMTAPLAGALLFIAETGNPWLGGAALLALGLGMGAPLVLIGSVGSQLLPKPGAWMTRVKTLFGFVLLGMAIWFIARILADAIVLGLWGALGLGAAISLVAMTRGIDPRGNDSNINRSGGVSPPVATAGAAIIGLWSALILIGAAGGAHDPWRPLSVYVPSGAEATSEDTRGSEPIAFDDVKDLATLERRVQATANSGQMTLVEFTADWCISCEVIEREVFSDPSVKNAIQGVQRLSIDVTDYDTEDQAIMQRFGIVGPPTLMWFGPGGQEQRGARIIGELDAEAFLDRYAQARRSAIESEESSS
ncbi:protein-disulfide reductase DsbD [Salinicola corii]|uniref:Thiol:disulfide interchange protein DsbD n=1 Tax=Salinicola corii TaxID=2606937 RepID=A0A640WGR9_9GAMM|nr:protein-disulfide reductase DsbD [Salinicola corii]KAA0019542.1 protein-disulfide reductase DsbD [Salinicola corii]